MKQCPVCNAKATNKYFDVPDSRYLDTKREFSYFLCGVCKSLFLSGTKINSSFYNKYYGDKYYKYDNGIKYYLESLYGKFINSEKREILRELLKNSGRIGILDIGSGNLEFLQALDEKKYMRCGIDIYNSNFDKNTDIMVINRDFLTYKFGQQKFDLITAWHVIEHIADPNKFISKIKSLLTRNGYAIISTPNLDGFGFRLFNGNWFHLDAPRHLVLFNNESLKKMIIKLGFSVVREVNMFYEFPLDIFHSAKVNFVYKVMLLPVYLLLKIIRSETVTLVLRKK